MATVIKVERLGKKYWIGGRRKQRYTALRDVLTDEVKNLFTGAATRRLQKEKKAFWALQDISFEVEQGEVLGVIGPNGAGKSTLLKILSRITEPTTGCVTLHGRVASLLEVGTGFHPELTGRENIYLSGAILGMKRMEIRRQFEEIVAFSGVEPFLDTPVKHYSSGMRVRLGFAIAAHLQPEILLVDEILAVGDAEFQKKCLGKMDEVAKGGRTVLFVSHDLRVISTLCENVILLNEGRYIFSGATIDTLKVYQSMIDSSHQRKTFNSIIKKIEFLADGKTTIECKEGDYVTMIVHVESSKPLASPVLGVVIKNQAGLSILGVNNKHYSQYFDRINLQKGKITIDIASFPPLKPGSYGIDVYIGDREGDREVLTDGIKFRVRSKENTNLNLGHQEQLNILQLNGLKWHISETD